MNLLPPSLTLWLKTRTPLLGAGMLLGASLVGCDDASSPDFVWPQETGDAVQTYARIAEATYADTHEDAEELQQAIDAFLSAPSEATLDAARTAWLSSRESYLQTEVFRFYDGPIDNAEDGPEGLINAWPLDENYIDYVDGDPNAGIIQGSDSIDATTLVNLNEAGGEKNVATGYHAIEFLLWGQDLDPQGPGARPHTDYLSDGGASQPERRSTYLRVVADLLTQHLTQVRDAWAPSATYRVSFEAAPQDAFRDALTGMIILSGFETGGERLQAAIDSGDQEDEHSCFSDNTHRDMVQDVRGVQNVWRGRYTRTDGMVVEGVGIRDVVRGVDSDLADRVDARIDLSLSLAEALQPPFDQEIAPGSPGNARVIALIQSLREQERLLSEVFAAFGLSVQIPE